MKIKEFIVLKILLLLNTKFRARRWSILENARFYLEFLFQEFVIDVIRNATGYTWWLLDNVLAFGPLRDVAVTNIVRLVKHVLAITGWATL